MSSVSLSQATATQQLTEYLASDTINGKKTSFKAADDLLREIQSKWKQKDVSKEFCSLMTRTQWKVYSLQINHFLKEGTYDKKNAELLLKVILKEIILYPSVAKSPEAQQLFSTLKKVANAFNIPFHLKTMAIVNVTDFSFVEVKIEGEQKSTPSGKKD